MEEPGFGTQAADALEGLLRPSRGRRSPEPLLLDVDEAAAVLGVGRTFVYGLLKEGLPHCKLGSRTKIPAAALRAYVQRQLTVQADADRALAAQVEARLGRRPTGRGRPGHGGQ
jgi:excisionase family DNA binding protein